MTTPNPQYEQDIPLQGDDLATSQGQFLINFQKLYEAFAKNHVALDATSAGNHKVVELLGSVAGFETDVGELSFYSKPMEGQTNQLFMRYQGNGTEVPITNYQLYSIPPTAQRTQYFTFLPGKILIYYGLVAIPQFPFKLDLNPGIARNIIAANFCQSQTPNLGPDSPPLVDPIVSLDGIIRQLQLIPAFPLIPIRNESFFYMVMVNI